MELITQDNGRLEVSPYALTVHEFKTIWERNEDKDRAIKELSFIYFIADYKSVYRGYQPKDKVERVCKDLGLDSNAILDTDIQLAINKYIELQHTPTMRLLNDIETSLDRIGFVFRTYDPNMDRDMNKFKAMISSMKSIDGVIKGIAALRETVETEVANISHGKGGSRIGKRETPRSRG